MKKTITRQLPVLLFFLLLATTSGSQSLIATGADPYVRTDANNKHLVVSGGSGWVSTGAVIALYGATSTTTPSSMNFATGGASRMTIAQTGEVRVASSLYTQNLFVNSVDPYVRTDANNKHLVLSGGSGWVNTGACIVLYGATSATTPNTITFNAGGAQRMAIEADGGVRIGTVTTPNPTGYKLYVDQGILTEKVRVAVAGSAQWADYVFAHNYKLMPLNEVEAFIKNNNHLPGVPSAAEMVKEGNDLGKTDAKLLEKIEELTLYIIDLKKEIENVKQNQSHQNK